MNFTDFGFVLVVGVLFIVSIAKDRIKTRQALKMSKKVFTTQIPIFLSVFLLVGIFEAFLTKDLVQRLLGNTAGIISVLTATIVGGIATGPPAAAYPIARFLWDAGASHAAAAAFVVAWISIGTVTLPMEIATFGRKFAITRWIASFVSSILIGALVGLII